MSRTRHQRRKPWVSRTPEFVGHCSRCGGISVWCILRSWTRTNNRFSSRKADLTRWRWWKKFKRHHARCVERNNMDVEFKGIDYKSAENRILADLIIGRLNALLEGASPEVRRDISAVFQARVLASETTRTHPTIQCVEDIGAPAVGVLGLLNGMIGVIEHGPKKGSGYITAIFNDDGLLKSFELTGPRGEGA